MLGIVGVRHTDKSLQAMSAALGMSQRNALNLIITMRSRSYFSENAPGYEQPPDFATRRMSAL